MVGISAIFFKSLGTIQMEVHRENVATKSRKCINRQDIFPAILT